MKALEVFRSDSTRRFLLVAFFTLTVVLLAARWAAREFPLSNHYAWRTGIWADDRYLLVSQQSKSNHRWGASTRAKYFLIDCEQESWTDIGRELGIDDFSPEDAFCTPDGCFFLSREFVHFGGIKQGIKFDPRTKKTTAITPFDSCYYSNVGNQYLLSSSGRRCINLLENSVTETTATFADIRPVDGAASFVVEHRYTPTVSQPAGSGMGGIASYGGEEYSGASTKDQLRNESNSPDDNDASSAIGEETQLTAEETEIRAEAVRLGLQPDDVILCVLYHIVDNQPVETNRWFTPESSWSPQSSVGLIADQDTNQNDVFLIRSGVTGELLRSISQPTADFSFNFEYGILRFQDLLHGSFVDVDARTGKHVTLDRLTASLIARNDKYIVARTLKVPWIVQVQKVSSDEVVLGDLNSGNWCVVDLTVDGSSLKLLTENDSVIFLNIESGETRVLNPRVKGTWLCYLIWGILAAWIMWWIVKCHQLQLPIQLQAVVIGLSILLIGYWRLTLADTETIRERPAFFAMMGLAVWVGYTSIFWMATCRLPFLAKVFIVQILLYVWYYYVYWPKVAYFGGDRYVFEAITIFSAVLLLIAFKPTKELIGSLWNKKKVETLRFSITNIVWLTTVSAICVHQVKLINWEPVVRTGLSGFSRSSIPHWTVAVVLAVVAEWVSARMVKFWKTSILVIACTIVVLASWNSVVAMTQPLYGNSYFWWNDLGYYVQAPCLFVGPILLSGVNFRRKPFRAVKAN